MICDSNLEHAGVKGMKWGVRKDKNKMSRKETRAIKKQAKRYIKEMGERSEAHNAKWSKRYANRGSMSDADLKRYTQRLKLENALGREVKTISTFRPPSTRKAAIDLLRDINEITGLGGRTVSNIQTQAEAVSRTQAAVYNSLRSKKASRAPRPVKRTTP